MTAARDLSLESLSLEQDGRVLTARYASPPLSFVTIALVRDLDRLTTFHADITRLGDTPFLVEPEPWIEGTKVDQVT